MKFNFLLTEEKDILRWTFCIPSVPCNLIQVRRHYFPQEVQREVFSVWKNQMGLAASSIYNLDLKKQYGPKTNIMAGYYGWAPDHVTSGTLLRCYPKTMGFLDHFCLVWISKCEGVRKYRSSRLQVSSSLLTSPGADTHQNIHCRFCWGAPHSLYSPPPLTCHVHMHSHMHVSSLRGNTKGLWVT